MTSNMDCDPDHVILLCSLSGMHWDSQQHTVIRVKWADMTHDGDDGDSLWNIAYQLHIDTWEDFIEFSHHGSFKYQATCHVTAYYNLTLVRHGSLDKAPVNNQPQIWQWKC